MAQNPAGMWYGFLSLFTGILGVMLVIKGSIQEPRSDLLFFLGLFGFGAAFLLRILQGVYASKNAYSDPES
jgi:hypothetical protein